MYKLYPNFADVFNLANENGDESIFEIQYKSGGLGEGSTFAADFIPQNSNVLIGGVGSALGNNEPTVDLYNSYDPADKRKDMIGKLADGRMYTKKYLETIKVAGDGDHNFIVLRYADVTDPVFIGRIEKSFKTSYKEAKIRPECLVRIENNRFFYLKQELKKIS
ncbi:MAG TPA: hypothetical protein VIM77_13600, partial [Mucilaginibacter sp.]